MTHVVHHLLFCLPGRSTLRRLGVVVLLATLGFTPPGFASNAPDLLVNNASVSNATPAPGATFRITARAYNRGDGASAATTLRFIRSDDSTITTDDTELSTSSIQVLWAREGATRRLQVSIPDEGTYWVGACVDTVRGESDTNNNCSAAVAVTVAVPIAPDLTIDSISVSNTTPGPGTPFTINATVQNSGIVAAAATTLRYYRSTDGRITTADTELATDPVGALAAGGSSQQSAEVSIADARTYWVGACAATVGGESDTNNNCSRGVQVILGPNLVVEDFSVSDATQLHNVPFTINATVRNRGGSAAAATTLRWRRGFREVIAFTEPVLTTSVVGALAPGESSQESATIKIHWPYTWWLAACLDTVDGVPGRDALNRPTNCSDSVPVNITTPDLKVKIVSVSNTTPEPGEAFTIAARVDNQSNGIATATTLSYFYGSGAGWNQIKIAQDAVEGLAPGASSSVQNASVSIPDAGNWWVKACAAPVVGEFERANNCSGRVPIAVAAPDLIVYRVSASSTSDQGTGVPFTIAATVHNRGAETAAATTLFYYRSNDSIITTADTEIATDPVGALAAGGSSQQNATVSIANTGRYWVGACADPVAGEVARANCSRGVQVKVVGPPNLIVNNVSVSNATPAPGAAFTINARAWNRGPGAAAATTLRFIRSDDSTITTDDTELSTSSIQRLWDSQGAPRSAEVSIAEAGNYWFGACVDPVAGEVARANCSRGVQVTVGADAPPDLLVDNVSASNTTPGAGVPFSIVARVRNQSTGESTATTLRYVRSTDSTITADDTELATDPVEGLAANGSSQQNAEVSIADAGVYWVGACASPVNGETARTNNCSTGVQVTVIGPPDLTVDGAAVSDAAPEAGTTFTIEATVRNLGAGTATTTRLRYFRSDDATITADDTQIDTDTISELAANGSSQQSAEVSIADTGSYWVGACVDTVSGETAENNNCSAGVQVTITGPPDLIVARVTVSDVTPEPGASFTINARVRNRGGGAAAATTLRYYLSVDNKIRTTDTELTTDAVGELAAAATSDQNAVVSIAEAGEYWVGACVDEVVGEVARTNCSRGPRVSVTAPDLTVGSVSVSPSSKVGVAQSSEVRVAQSSVEAGVSFTINATVRNSGDKAAPGSTLRYYRSATSTITTNDTLLATDPVSALAPDATSSESAAVSIANTGSYWVGACVSTVSGETEMDNNCSTGVEVSVTAAPVTAPDLTVDGVRASESSVEADASFTINATARNSGDGDADATTLYYYSSTDSTITANDTQLATDPVSALEPDATSAESAAVSIANTGSYWVGACVSTVSGESEAGNNCSSSVEVTVTASPVTAPDLTVNGIRVSQSNVEAGVSFTINATARNSGDGDADATTLFYYRSTDNTITATDTELATDPVSALALGTTSAESAVVSIPNTGSYWVGACVGTVSGEAEADNNCSTGVAVSITAAPVTAPDLTVDGVRVSESSVEAGGSFTINATARNSGNEAAPGSTLRYYRSTTNTITTTDTLLATDPVSALEAGATSPENAAVSIANTGSYWVGACVSTVSGESEAGNNCSSGVEVTVTAAPVTAPDLTVDGIRVSQSSVEVGTSFTINATARNSGDGAAPGSTLRYYRSANSSITTNDTLLATDPVSALTPGATSPENATVSIPNTGSYWVGACVSTVSGEAETDNNCSTGVSITVTAAPVTAPDLTVDGVSVSESSVETGVSFTINATARNSGNETSDATTLFYYRSTDSTITTNDTELTTDTVDGLAPSGFSSESATVSIADVGEYWVGACADTVDDETTVGNNCSTGVAVTVAAAPVTVPDLTVDSVRVSQSSVEASASFTINATARNSGNKAADATTLSYYRSTDSTITANDTAFTTDTVDGLTPNGFSAESATVSITDIGEYWVGVCINTVDGETAVGNNCSSGVQVTVTAPALPDLTVDNIGVSDAAPEVGTSFTINATVRNQGTEASPETTLRYYRSDDDVIDSAADTELAAEPVTGLAIDASSTHTAAVAIPDAGRYWIGVCVDTVSEETAADNNCSSGVPVTIRGAVSAADNSGKAALPTIIRLLLER